VVTPSVREEDHLATSTGALITSIEPGSPAASSSLQVGDVIVQLDTTPISSPDDLTAAIHPLQPGQHVSLVVYRGPSRRTIGVTLGARPAGG
jgi:S1-C subfamily serine protease